jgi:hypothetical protein
MTGVAAGHPVSEFRYLFLGLGANLVATAASLQPDVNAYRLGV